MAQMKFFWLKNVVKILLSSLPKSQEMALSPKPIMNLMEQQTGRQQDNRHKPATVQEALAPHWCQHY